jgi:hypothetical protein
MHVYALWIHTILKHQRYVNGCALNITVITKYTCTHLSSLPRYCTKITFKLHVLNCDALHAVSSNNWFSADNKFQQYDLIYGYMHSIHIGGGGVKEQTPPFIDCIVLPNLQTSELFKQTEEEKCVYMEMEIFIF